MIPRSPISTLFPYTTLFRSVQIDRQDGLGLCQEVVHAGTLEPAVVITGGAIAPACLGKVAEIDAHRFQFFRSEEHTSELQSRPHLVCRLLLEKKKKTQKT